MRTPQPVTLHGRVVRLEPLGPEHVDDLFAAGGDDEVWRWLPAARPTSAADVRVLVDEAVDLQQRGLRLPFAVVDTRTGRAVGSTSYLDIEAAHRRLEIGWTWLGRAVWRTAVNTDAKLLLLGHAFDELGALRVALKTDGRNLRSQQAIARLGAQREGVLRAHMVRPDGSSRDTVYYSILRDEWPAVRERLVARLEEG